tara:strand:+ start:283 stop:540 length:258 start_codon:yes stop_codon:yes gene_type:complete
MSDYGSPKTEPEPEPVPAPTAPATKKKREGKKLTDKQKMDLNKHMEKVGKDMSVKEKKSHRMKMMSRMRNKDMSIAKAHKDLMSS